MHIFGATKTNKMITTKEYIEHLMNVRNDFFNLNNYEAAFKVQKDIDNLISQNK